MPGKKGSRWKHKAVAHCHPDRPHAGLGLCATCYKQRPEYKTQAGVYGKQYRLDHPEEVRRANKHGILRRLYGITLAQYEQMLQDQGGCCALCGQDRSKFSRDFAVDHDHKTGRVRGLLCVYCNTSVGQIERVGVENIHKVIGYLQ